MKFMSIRKLIVAIAPFMYWKITQMIRWLWKARRNIAKRFLYGLPMLAFICLGAGALSKFYQSLPSVMPGWKAALIILPTLISFICYSMGVVWLFENEIYPTIKKWRNK